jgi:ribonuclease HII
MKKPAKGKTQERAAHEVVPKIKFIIGIDEVGRGPLAGPVAVCACALPYADNAKNSYKKFLNIYAGEIRKEGLINLKNKDSKKLTEARRASWKDFLKNTHARFAYGHMSAREIDKKGIAHCIRALIQKNLSVLLLDIECAPQEALILLDGGLKAPAEFSFQKTIIKGDEKELVIGLASIFAKVTRDEYMKTISKKNEFKAYDFEIHKGYGTLAHRKAIQRNGLSSLHRKTFCTRITSGTKG